MRDRIRAAEDAAIEYIKNRPTCGFPTLKQTFGDVIAKQVAEWLEYPGSTSDHTGPAGSGSNSKNQLPLYAEVAKEMFRENERARRGLCRSLPTRGAMSIPGCIVPDCGRYCRERRRGSSIKSNWTLRDMNLCESSKAKFIYEARKYIERSPNIRTQDKIAWDDHGKIPTRAGLIDPVRLVIEPLKKEDYATWCLDVEHNRGATCPLWLEMLNRNKMALDTLAGVRGEMARLYRLALNGRIRSDEMTRFVYALKEIRACLEAEILTDVQQRLALLSRNMGNHNGHHILHQPTFPSS